MTCAVAGATMTRSAACPRRVCGIGVGPSHSSVCTGSLASALSVVRPRKCSAPRVITGTTWAPASISRRHTSTALYAAIPPVTPSTMRDPASTAGVRDQTVRGVLDADRLLVERLGLALRGGSVRPADLVGGDLLEADAQRLAGDGADLRRHHVPEPLTELVEVGVDVAGPPGGQRDQAELGVDPVEELLDRRVHHRVVRAFHHFSMPRSDPPLDRAGGQPSNPTGEGTDRPSSGPPR